MIRFTKTAVLFSGLLLVAGAASASAISSLNYFTSYTVTLDLCSNGGVGGCSPDGSTPNVTNILMLENGPGVGSTTWPFSANGEGTTVLNNPFPFTTPPTESLLIGLTAGLPGDASVSQEHVVLLMDPTAGNLAAGIGWSTLFPNTDETQLIADIELATSGQAFSVIQPGLDGIGAFGGGDATSGILDNQAVPHSAFFATGGAFTVESFSDGTILGSGFSSIAAVPAGGAAPEPAGYLLGGLGLCLALGTQRFLSARRAQPGCGER